MENSLLHYIWNEIKIVLFVLKDILPVMSIIIAYVVFRFTKKISYSKLTVKHNIHTYGSSESKLYLMDNKYSLSEFDSIKPKKGMPSKELTEWEIQAHELGIDSTRTQPEVLTIQVVNKGDIASTNIKISLIYKTYGSKVTYKNNKDDTQNKDNVKSHKRKKFVFKKIVIKIPYIGADEEKEYVLTELNGQFRETELILSSIYANGHNYFKESIIQKILNNRVILYTYRHPYLNSQIDDVILLGLNNPDGKWKAAYKNDGGLQ